MTPSPSYRAQPQQRQQQMQQPRQSQQRQYYGAPQQHQQGAPASNVATQAPAQPAPAPQQSPAQPVNAWGAANDAWKAQQNGGGQQTVTGSAPMQPAQTAPAPVQPAQQQSAPPQAQSSYLDAPAPSAATNFGTFASMARPSSGMRIEGIPREDASPHETTDAWDSGGTGDAMKDSAVGGDLAAPSPIDMPTGTAMRQRSMKGSGGRNYYGM